MAIRRANHSDLPDIYRCLSQMVTYIPSHESQDEIAANYFKQDWVHAIVSEVIEHPSQRVIVGFASISFEMKIRGGVIGHIEDVVVDHRWRKSGLGRELVEALKEEGKRRGAYRIYLECAPENADFYRNCGFVHSGVSMRWDV